MFEREARKKGDMPVGKGTSKKRPLLGMKREREREKERKLTIVFMGESK